MSYNLTFNLSFITINIIINVKINFIIKSLDLKDYLLIIYLVEVQIFLRHYHFSFYFSL
jgi:hypothetical protein